jgi:hypothetical protein
VPAGTEALAPAKPAPKPSAGRSPQPTRRTRESRRRRCLGVGLAGRYSCTLYNAGSEQLKLWPFTTSNYLPGAAGQSDPVNLVFLYADPRAIRQELMTLDGDRPTWSFLPSGAKGCVWMDGMG